MAIVRSSVLNAAEAGPRKIVLPASVGIDLADDSTGFGPVLSASGAGALPGFLLADALPSTQNRGIILVGFAPSIPFIIVLAVGQGVCSAIVGLLWQTSINEFVPVRMHGRVFSFDMFGSFSLLPFSMAISGALAAALGSRTVFMLGGATVILCAAIGLLHPRARRFEKPAE